MKSLSVILLGLVLSACAVAQDRLEEHYTLQGDGECDTVLTITTDDALDVAVFDSSDVQIAGTNLHAGDVWDAGLPIGRADYILTVWHEGAAWSYDLRVGCPPTPAPDETTEAHGLAEYLTQRGIDPTRGVVVTMIPARATGAP